MKSLLFQVQEDILLCDFSGRITTQGVLMVKNLPVNAGDACLIPTSGRPPEVVNGNPLHYFCLENPMDRGAWWITVHRVTKSRTRLSTHLP